MSSQPFLPGSLYDAPSHSDVSGIISRQGRRALAFLKSVANRLMHIASWSRSVRFVSYRKALWQRRSLYRALGEAQLALGQRMYEAGIDDGELGAQIGNLDEKLRKAQASCLSTRELESERIRLLVQLAAAALAEDGPLPGAEAEYAKARAVQAALRD